MKKNLAKELTLNQILKEDDNYARQHNQMPIIDGVMYSDPWKK